MASEFVEEYLEALYDLSKISTPVKTTDVSSYLNIAPASVTEMLQKLAKSKYIEYKKYYGATLTPKGEEIAAQIKRRHRLAEKFLSDILGMEDVHDVACGLEHLLGGEFEKRLCQLLDRPTLCPDEKEIPPCEHGFEACKTCTPENLTPLTTLQEGEHAQIKVVVEDRLTRERLFSQGITPGKTISLVKKEETYSLFNIDDKQIALEHGLVKKILISKKPVA
jgi:DtxR family Mn-dependent transcriptional regulator